jgi:transcriptional regulator with PAS, ATPase and Fis domain
MYNKEGSEIKLAAAALGDEVRFGDMADQGPLIQAAIEKARHYARHDSAVLITGETGTGKEIFAHSIHHEGLRGAKPFIAVNCSAIPTELFENEFFGHVRGAFTGALAGKQGYFEQADGGTVFLDEVNSLPLTNQPKLLRLLQTREFCRLGEAVSRKFDARIISASNCDLEQEVRAGRFRSDLYYRLAVLELSLPPLREHREDIPLLAMRRLRTLMTKQHAAPSQPLSEVTTSVHASFTPEALKKMMDYSWPGNVRELESEVERAMILAHGAKIDAHDLQFEVEAAVPAEESFQWQKRRMIHEFTRRKISEFLVKANGNATHAAGLGRMDPRALFRLMRKHNIKRSRN